MNREQFILHEMASKDTIDFKKIYVDVANDLNAGLALSEIIYWYLPKKDGTANKLKVTHEGHEWIACRRYEWWDRTRMSPKQSDRALAILEESHIIIKRLFKFDGDPTIHVRLNWESFLELFDFFLSNKPENPFSPKVNNEIPQEVITLLPKGETPVTENTTEITTENKKIPPPQMRRSSDWNFNLETIGDEEPPKRLIVERLNKLFKTKKLSASMIKRLEGEISVINNGAMESMTSPADLYDKDSVFQNYVEWAIKFAQTNAKKAGKQVGGDYLTKLIAGYDWHKIGWLVYEGEKRKYDTTNVPVFDAEEDDEI